jgi:hypothetical protein
VPRESAYLKARRYLTEGRVIVTHLDQFGVSARVRGDGAIWSVEYGAGVWTCTCPARSDQCSHCRAVRLVTSPEVSW